MAEKYTYAGFWRRLGAFFVDLLVLIPLMAVHFKLYNSQSRWIALTSLIVFCALQQVYVIYCHGKWGKTIGKMATGIQVVSLDFQPVSWRSAVMRNSVDIVFYTFSLLGTSIAFAAISDEAMANTGSDMAKLVMTMRPPWSKYVDWGQQAWVWSEFIIMMSNQKRRALHDFIAGTVVIQVRGVRKKTWDKDDPMLMDYSKDLKRMKDPLKL